MDFNKIKEITDSITYPILFAVNDTIWCRSDDTLYWIDEKGDLYDAYITEGYEELEDYLIANADTQTGTWMTFVFKLSNETSYEEFENKYEAQM